MRCDIKALGHYIGTWVSKRALVFFTRSIISGPKPLPPLAGASLDSPQAPVHSIQPDPNRVETILDDAFHICLV